MNPSDDKFKQLLGQWHEIEPRAQFEADVMRRIRQSAPETGKTGWFGQLAWANAMALVLGITIGTVAGLSPITSRQDVALIKPGTVAGNYVSMISGGTP